MLKVKVVNKFKPTNVPLCHIGEEFDGACTKKIRTGFETDHRGTPDVIIADTQEYFPMFTGKVLCLISYLNQLRAKPLTSAQCSMCSMSRSSPADL